MPIPENQLETWSHQGSITQSSTTYNTIKSALESPYSPYADKDYTIFLQGSYGNDTNIYTESDVDIVILLNSTFYHDLENLPDDQKAAFKDAHSNAAYGHASFKQDVLAFLKEKYGDSVKDGKKAIQIEANGSRRKADVIVACEFRRYYKFLSTTDESHDTGICFFTADDTQIINYPKQHSENCTTKHKATKQNLKPMVRIIKNMRSRMVKEGTIEAGLAPSYYIEGLLYNVPNDKFCTRYEDSFINCINWIIDTDRKDFVCANEQYYLLCDGSPVTWRKDECTKFIDALCTFWNNWK
jgi:hypothetical protein